HGTAKVLPAFCRQCCSPIGLAEDAGSTLGFMESLLSFFRMHWDLELPGGGSAGVLACECTGRPARCSCWRRDAAATRSRDGCATRFMESPTLLSAHWDDEPTPNPSREGN